MITLLEFLIGMAFIGVACIAYLQNKNTYAIVSLALGAGILFLTIYPKTIIQKGVIVDKLTSSMDVELSEVTGNIKIHEKYHVPYNAFVIKLNTNTILTVGKDEILSEKLYNNKNINDTVTVEIYSDIITGYHRSAKVLN